jgi:hypothetical protein
MQSLMGISMLPAITFSILFLSDISTPSLTARSLFVEIWYQLESDITLRTTNCFVLE